MYSLRTSDFNDRSVWHLCASASKKSRKACSRSAAKSSRSPHRSSPAHSMTNLTFSMTVVTSFFPPPPPPEEAESFLARAARRNCFVVAVPGRERRPLRCLAVSSSSPLFLPRCAAPASTANVGVKLADRSAADRKENPQHATAETDAIRWSQGCMITIIVWRTNGDVLY